MRRVWWWVCSRRAGRTTSPRCQRRRSAVLVLPSPTTSSTSPASTAPLSFPAGASSSSSYVASRRTKHSSLTTTSSPPPVGTAVAAAAVECVAVVKPASSQQRYSLSAIVIPKLSISDDADSAADGTSGQLERCFARFTTNPCFLYCHCVTDRSGLVVTAAREDPGSRRAAGKSLCLATGCTLTAVPSSTQPSSLRGTVNEYQPYGDGRMFGL